MVKKRCCVCKNNADNYEGSFSMFPTNTCRRIDWFRQIGVPESEQMSLLTARLYICAEHFDQTSASPVIISRKMSHCIVGGCEKRTRDYSNIATHRLPLEAIDCAAWVSFAENLYVTKQYAQHGPVGVRNWRICSKHFESKCYRCPATRKQGLKPGSLPTLHQAIRDDDEEERQFKLLSPRPVFSLVKQGSVSRIANKRKFKQLNMVKTPVRDTEKPIVDPLKCAPLYDYSRIRNAERKPTTIGRNNYRSTQTEEIGRQPGPLPIPAEQSDCCRLCFTTQRLEPLCSGTIVVRDEMLDKIYVCTGILIIPKPKKSIFICQPCAQTISIFHTYRQQICSNNRALSAYFARKVRVNNYCLPLAVAETTTSKTQLPVREAPTANIKEISLQVEMVEGESCIDLPDIKLEPVDPLEDSEEPRLNEAKLSMESSVDTLFFECLPEDTQTITMNSELPVDSMDFNDLPNAESWVCWHCGTKFAFKFECAKHLLKTHREAVSQIENRLKLDELDRNMLEMMSKEHDQGQPTPRKTKKLM